MMKHLVALLLCVVGLLVPVPVSAWETTGSANITITVVGWIADTPGLFTVTYISDTELELSWIKGYGADNTMIRAAYGRMPTDRDDGYLVYYGDGTTVSDTAIDLDEMALPVYYRAWSQSVGGAWEEVGASSFMEGPGMKLVALVILCLGMLAFAWHMRKVSLLFVSLMCWLGFTAYAFGLSDGTMDFYRILAWIGIAMAFLSVYQVVNMLIRNRPEPEPDVDPTVAAWQDMADMKRQMDIMLGKGIPARRAEKARM